MNHQLAMLGLVILAIFAVVCIGCIVTSLVLGHNIHQAQEALAKNDMDWGDRHRTEDALKEHTSERRMINWVIVGTAVCMLVAAGLNCIYSQDAGDVVVLRSISEAVDGMSKDAGFHFKAPWQETVAYDQRNNVISFIADGEEDYTGGSANGPQVTVNDAAGASADVDIQVNYSLNPDYAMDLYRDYGTQETFVRSVVAVDVRSLPHEQSGQFDTLTMMNNCGEFAQAVEEALSAKWADMGLIIEQVSIQDVRYDPAIEEKYNQAQEAEVAKQQALNEQETAKVQAETRRIEAEGQAEANRTLQESLTDEVLMQHYIDKLSESEFIVVPQGNSIMLDLGGALGQSQRAQ